MDERRVAGGSSELKRKRRKEKLQGKVNLKLPGEEEQPPFVVHFPSGYVPGGRMHGREGGGEGDVAIKSYEGSRTASSGRHLLVMETPVMDFVGRSLTADAQMWNPVRYALAVFNKRTGEMTMMPVAADKVLRMEPRVRGVSYGNAALEEEKEKVLEDETTKAEELAAKRRSLTAVFGSKKKQRELANYDKGRIKDDHIGASSALSQLVQSATQREGMLTMAEAEAQHGIDQHRNMPFFNKQAEKAEDVYPIDKIIKEDEWELLDTKASELVAAQKMKQSLERIQKIYPAYVRDRASLLLTNVSADEAKRRACLLVYLTFLITFYKAPPGLSFRRSRNRNRPNVTGEGDEEGELVITKKTMDEEEDETYYTSTDPETVGKVLQVPRQIVEKFMSLYSQRESEGERAGRVRRLKSHRDLLISTILVVALHVEGFNMDPHMLGDDLELSSKLLTPYLKELGCKLTQVRSKESKLFVALRYRVTLPVPLKFPPPKRASRK